MIKMATKPTASSIFHGAHKIVFLGNVFELDKPSPDHDVYLMWKRSVATTALSSAELAAMSGPDAIQVKRMLMAGIGKRYKDVHGMPAPITTWLESIKVEDLQVAIAHPEDESPVQVLLRATLSIELMDAQDQLPGQQLGGWLRMKACTASFTIDHSDGPLLDKMIAAALQGYLDATGPALLEKATAVGVRQVEKKLDTGEPLSVEDIDLVRTALDKLPNPEGPQSPGISETTFVPAPNLGKTDSEATSIVAMPNAVQELIFEVQKLAELGLDQAVPDAALIAELEETFPKLPELNALPRKVRKLAEAAQIVVSNARNFELLDEEELKMVMKALKPFEQEKLAKRARVVGKAVGLLKNLALDGAGETGNVKEKLSQLLGLVQGDGNGLGGSIQALKDFASKVDLENTLGNNVLDSSNVNELKAILSKLSQRDDAAVVSSNYNAQDAIGQEVGVPNDEPENGDEPENESGDEPENDDEPELDDEEIDIDIIAY